MLGNYLQQTTSADDISDAFFSWRFKGSWTAPRSNMHTYNFESNFLQWLEEKELVPAQKFVILCSLLSVLSREPVICDVVLVGNVAHNSSTEIEQNEIPAILKLIHRNARKWSSFSILSIILSDWFYFRWHAVHQNEIHTFEKWIQNVKISF